MSQIKETINRHFLPATVEVPPDFITGDFCAQISHCIRKDRIEIWNLVDATTYYFESSKVVTLVDGGISKTTSIPSRYGQLTVDISLLD